MPGKYFVQPLASCLARAAAAKCADRVEPVAEVGKAVQVMLHGFVVPQPLIAIGDGVARDGKHTQPGDRVEANQAVPLVRDNPGQCGRQFLAQPAHWQIRTGQRGHLITGLDSC
jgi:hypothetical protein